MNSQDESSSVLSNITNRNELLRLIQERLKTEYHQIDQLFWAQHPIQSVLNQRALLIDRILKEIWQWFEIDHYPEVTLYAVGGYGRGLLHPFSDIDTLILRKEKDNPHLEQRIENFVSFIWDCGITLSSSVRTFEECIKFAHTDHTIFTHLLTFRYLTGNIDYTSSLEKLISPHQNKIWPFPHFFYAKQKERFARYQRYQNTEYNQEPNLKESPGGLRDIDFIHWIAQCKYGKAGMNLLVQEGTLSHYEFQMIENSQKHLWYMRYALHLIANKATDRLYLEYQSELVKKLKINSETLNHAISQWMQQYFRIVSQVREITDILSQYFSEEIQATQHSPPPEKQILSTFCIKINQFLDICNEEEYLKSPSLFMKLFLFYAKIPEVQGLSAKSRHFIYDYFNYRCLENLINDSEISSIFLKIFSYPQKSACTLALMHQLGALSKVITSFNDLIGQMQYDLSHIYTVDAHTLRVLQHIQDFYQEEQPEIPFLDLSLMCANDPIILYISALFHDIGKGKGGNHSEIGKELALEFCHTFQLTEKQTHFITWLVLNHLQLSHFAQRRDINDPNVIYEFSKITDTQEKLCYLYLLTIADIQGTNPKLWNEWRKALLSELFHKTYQYYNQQPENNTHQTTDYKKQLAATEIIKRTACTREKIDALWQLIHQDYFKNTDFNSLIWQTECLLSHNDETALIAIRPHWNKVGTDILIYAKNHLGLFAYLCQSLEKLLLTIVEAKIAVTTHDFCVYSMTILESSGSPITEPQRLLEIQSSLSSLVHIMNQSITEEILPLPNYSRHIPRWYRYYQTQAKVEIYTLPGSNYSTIEIHAPDFPGLLARISRIMVTHSIRIHSAKINTLGDKVIDFFYVSKKTDHPLLTDNSINLTIKNAILQALKP